MKTPWLYLNKSMAVCGVDASASDSRVLLLGESVRSVAEHCSGDMVLAIWVLYSASESMGSTDGSFSGKEKYGGRPLKFSVNVGSLRKASSQFIIK